MTTIYGTFTIFIYCVGLQGMAIVTTCKPIARRTGVTRSEAETIRNEHAKQAATMPNSGDYSYRWQADGDDL